MNDRRTAHRAELRAVADAVMETLDLGRYQPVPPIAVDPAFGAAVADAFDALPHRDPAAAVAYRQLAIEVEVQFRALLALGYAFIPDDGTGDYGATEAMFRALDTKTLLVFTGGDPHAYLSDQENWYLRCVHDVFGHYLTGGSFGPNGEDRAWHSHVQMFSPLAAAAMTTETRGQNSWFWNSAVNAGKPGNQRSYADQKGALLPAWCLRRFDVAAARAA